MASNSIDEGEIVPGNNSTTLSGNTKVNAIHGVFTFDNFIIIAEPGRSVNISVISLAVDTNKAEKA